MAQVTTPIHQEGSEILLEAASLEIYRTNAFRVAELPVDTGARDLSKRQQMVEIASKAGMPIPSGSGRALPLAESTDPDTLREALQRLRDPERRLVDELFWFWPHHRGQRRNDEALEALAQDDVEKAQNIWLQQEQSSEANVSVHNLAVLFHVQALDLEAISAQSRSPLQHKQLDYYWEQALKRWRVLFDHEGFWNRVAARVQDLDDPRLTAETANQLRAALPMTLLLINAKLAVQAAERGDATEANRLLSLIRESGFNSQDVDEALKQAIEPIRGRIKVICKTTNNNINSDPAHANEDVERLFKQASPLLETLDCLLPRNHPTRDGMHDEVSLAILQGMIAFGNETKNWEGVLDPIKKARGLATTGTTQGRLDENLRIVEGNIQYARDFLTCWFCQKNPMNDVAAVEVKMYGDVVSTPTWQGSQLTWRHGSVKIPRCEECKAAHTQVEDATNKGCLVGLVPGFVIGFFLASTHPGNRFIDLIAIAAIVACVTGIIILVIFQQRAEKKHLVPKSIKPVGDKEYPVIKELLAQGWQFGEKPNTN